MCTIGSVVALSLGGTTDTTITVIRPENATGGTIRKEIAINPARIQIAHGTEIVAGTETITSHRYAVKNSNTTVLDTSIKMALKLFEARNRTLHRLLNGTEPILSNTILPTVTVCIEPVGKKYPTHLNLEGWHRPLAKNTAGVEEAGNHKVGVVEAPAGGGRRKNLKAITLQSV